MQWTCNISIFLIDSCLCRMMANQCFGTASFIHRAASLLLPVQMVFLYVSSPYRLTWLHLMILSISRLERKSSSNTSLLIFIIITIWHGGGVSVYLTFNLPLGPKQVICSISDSRDIENNSSSSWVELKRLI